MGKTTTRNVNEAAAKGGILDAAERAQADALLNDGKLLAAVMDTVGALIVVFDREGRILRFNRACEVATGYTAQEVHGRRFWDLLVPPEEAGPVQDVFAQLKAGRFPSEFENHWLARDGTRRLLHWNNSCLTGASGEVEHIIGSGIDITRITRDEQWLRTLNRTLRALNDSSQALVRATDESSLLQEVCRIIVEDCGHAMVWVGFAENDADKSIRPVACSGFEEGYLETLRLTWADTERGRGPKGTAIRTGQIAMCRNMLTDPSYAPWRQEATRRGYASSIALPLASNGTTFGALSLYCREPDPFTADEINLLSELAGDLAFGISSLRMRVANAAAEEALRKSEAQFRTLFESACDGILIADQQGRYIDANACALAMLGLTRHGLLGRNIGDIVIERERKRVPDAVAEVCRGHPHIAEWQFIRGNGTVFCGEINAHLLPDGRMIGILRDLTERKQVQRERDLTIEFLRTVNRSKNTDELLRKAVRFFKDHAGCDAVGIRLRNGDDFPYRETLGFSKEFLEAESSLCGRCKSAEPPLLACLCGKVIKGQLSPRAADFTAHGSFWSNDTSDLLKAPFTDQDLIRGRCRHEGYGSIALLPLHEGAQRMGLLQLNFRNTGAFTPENIAFAERLADHLAVAVAKFMTEDALRASEEFSIAVLDSLPAHIAVLDRRGSLVSVNARWRQFALENGAKASPAVSVGANYLEACRQASQQGDALAQAALDGIQAVLTREQPQFQLEYPCNSPGRERWFLLLASPIPSKEGQVILTHLDVTARKRAEQQIQQHVESVEAMNAELARFNRAAVGRELRMIALKREINAIRVQAGQAALYPLAMEEVRDA